MHIYNPVQTRVFAAALSLVALSLAVPRPSSASTFDNKPKILLHVKSTTTKNACAFGALDDAQNAVVSGPLTNVGGPGYYFVYLIVAKGNVQSLPGLAGLQCGLKYDGGQADRSGIDIFGWTRCATLEFITGGANMWPASGGGNLITWDKTNDCQLGDTAVAGYFYLAAYSSATFGLTPRPVDGLAKVANCQSAETTLGMGDLGCAGFSLDGTAMACNPAKEICLCPGTPTETTTWSRIKASQY